MIFGHPPSMILELQPLCRKVYWQYTALNSTAIPSFSYYKEEVKVGIAYFSHFSTFHITGERDDICICVTSSWQIIIC
jgi:hypothetical protein